MIMMDIMIIVDAQQLDGGRTWTPDTRSHWIVHHSTSNYNSLLHDVFPVIIQVVNGICGY